MNGSSLPGITKIEIIRCRDLAPHLMQHSMSGCIVCVAAPSIDIEFYGKPSLKWEGVTLNGTPQESSTLEFQTSRHIPQGEHLAFVVTTPSGKQYLIGTREGRFPVIKYAETTGDTAGTAAVRTYKITHIGLKSVLPCIL